MVNDEDDSAASLIMSIYHDHHVKPDLKANEVHAYIGW